MDTFRDEDGDPTLGRLIEIIREETEALSEILPDALARQWEVSPVPKPREDTTERSSGERSDPTADAALDGRRLDVRRSVRDAERLLRESAVRTRGVRLCMEEAVSAWDGGSSEGLSSRASDRL